MSEQKQAVRDLETGLGYRQLSRTWAKLEILLGLMAAGVAMLLGQWAFAQPPAIEWGFVVGSLILFILGWYLALAGHRSHLYQSSNESTAYLAEEIRRLKD